MNIHPMTSNPALRPPISGFGKTNLAAVIALAALGLLSFAGTAQAADNTGTGGTITYTDANGLNPVASPPYLGGFVVHEFTASGTLNVPTPTTADVLVVAGGGGGGSFSGGGGAGGLIYNNAFSVTGGSSYTVTVGAGGAGDTDGGGTGGQGSNSVFDTLTAIGGGGGGSRNGVAGVNGAAGGSGGGGSASDSPNPLTSGGAGTVGQGNAGGSELSNGWGGGGGGGAGAAGGNATGNDAGNGGHGLAYSISGTAVYYAGGGGGATFRPGAPSGVVGAGGLGGGGAGGPASKGIDGTANTGGGGGGGDAGFFGGSGGSGIVVVRYPYVSEDLAVTVTAPTQNQAVLFGAPITATASVVNGTAPFSVTFYKQSNGGGFTQVGSPDTTSPYEVSLGTLAVGTYQIYATATDTASGTATSATTTFFVYKEGNSGTGGTITYTDANGLNPRALPPYSDGYVVHKFTASDTLNVPTSTTADILVVGGGGGGGSFGAGGGAGGFLSNTASITGSTNYSVTVGAGGAGTGTPGAVGSTGNNSVFQSFTAYGGGGGGSRTGNDPATGVAGAAGGSGGGGSATDSGATSGGIGTLGQGNAGGGVPWSDGENNWGSGGGGGAGAAGGPGVAGTKAGGNGGVGLSSSITGTSIFYAGGGGGGTYSAATGAEGSGGNGGGGAGTKVEGAPGTDGTANTGGGGGGGGFGGTGGTGGSGILIVKYPYDPGELAVTVTAPANNQSILFGSPITATATVVNGTAPYSVNFYKQTNGGGFTPVGSPDTQPPYQVSLGTLAAGTYQIYATVSDSASGAATSATNTIFVYEEGNSGTGGTIVYTDANGLNPRALPPYTNGYVVHKFTANGTLNVPSPVTANVLVVAGGGGGGTNGGGGGGAGGLIYDNAYNVVAGAIPVTVGGGGAVHPNDASNPSNGGNSEFDSITALGGGGGSSRDGGGPGASGGSGGGGGGADGGSRYFAGAGTPGQGNNGGNGAGAGGIDNTGGGGGGAGSAGTAGVAGVAGNGGTGVSFPIFADIAGSPAGWFAGGGAGQRVFAGSNGTAGQGGGGAAGSPGVANTGGGGGGGGIGGSGIVLVRYPYQLLTSYQAWLVANGKTDSPENLREYAFGTTNTGAIVFNGPTSITLGQAPAMHISGTAISAVFGRRQDYLAAGLNYEVRFSADLVTWHDSTDTANLIYLSPPGVPTVVASQGDMDAVSIPFPIFIKTANGFEKTSSFMQIEITNP